MPRDPKDIAASGQARLQRRLAEALDQRDSVRVVSLGATNPEIKAELVRANAALTLEVAAADIPNCTLNTPIEGAWRIIGHFDFICEEAGSLASGICSIAGVAQTQVATFAGTAANQRVIVTQEWQTGVISKASLIRLRASRTGNKYKALSPNTTLSILRIA